MKPFKSILTQHMEDFIEYRAQLGYSEKMLIYSLKVFDQYVVEKKASQSSFTPLFFIKFRSDLKQENRSINLIVRLIKTFFNFLVRKDVIRENPLQDITGLPENNIVPFIFSPEETSLLLNTLIKLMRTTQAFYLNDFGAYIAFLMMARCGLRISETRYLLIKNYRPEERTIYIEKTKFKKDRLIPIPNVVASEINNFLSVRRLYFDEDKNPLLLIKKDQTGFSWSSLNQRFKRALKHLHFNQIRRTVGTTNFCAPTHHSLRHSFAVNTLKRIKQQGESPQSALPVLAVYMGHKEYKYTTRYLRVLDAGHRRRLYDFSITMDEKR
jgi:integrase/recombinase XerD